MHRRQQMATLSLHCGLGGEAFSTNTATVKTVVRPLHGGLPHDALSRFRFDTFEELELAGCGCLEWRTGAKETAKAFLQTLYFLYAAIAWCQL